MPIKSMKCASCGSKDVLLAINLGTGQIQLNEYGCVEYSYDDDIYKYKRGSSKVSILDLLDNIPLPQSDWDLLKLSGKLHHNPNHISCPSVSITGECQNYKGECSLVVRFEDGKKLGEQEALIKLVNELRNPISISNTNPTNVKITTDYLKSLIPQYIDEKLTTLNKQKLIELKNLKNWSRESKTKPNEIVRMFKYKPDDNIKLKIITDKDDTKVIEYEFIMQSTQDLVNGLMNYPGFSQFYLPQNENKKIISAKPKNKFDGYFIAEIVDMDNLEYSDPNYNFLVSINTVEAEKTGLLVDHYTREEAKALDPIFEEFNMCEFVESVYELEDNELTREEFAKKLAKYSVISEVKIRKSEQMKSEIKYVFCVFERPQGDYFFGGTTLILTPKNYWKKEQCTWDQGYPRKIIQILGKYGFSECMESMFSGDLSPDEIKIKLKAHPEFEYSKSFEKFNRDMFE